MGVSWEFLYFGSGRSGGACPGRGGRIRPPSATGRPEGSKIGKRTRARKESWARPRRLTKPSPESDSTCSGSGAPWPARPSRRAPSPGGSGGRLPRRSPGSAGSRAPVRRRARTGAARGTTSTARSMASSSSERRLWSRPASCVLVQGDAGPVGQQAHRVDEVEVLHGAHEGDGVARRLAAEAVVEALLGVDAERRRLLGVERAEPAPATAHLAQRGVLADQRDDVGGRPDLGDLFVRYPHARTVPRRCPADRPRHRLRARPGAGRSPAPLALDTRSWAPWPRSSRRLRRPRPPRGVRPGPPAPRRAGPRHPERRAAHVVEAGLVEEADRRRVAAVLAADADLEARPGGPAPLGPELDQLADAVEVDGLEGVARQEPELEVGVHHPALDVVAAEPERHLREVVGAEGEEVGHLGDLVGPQRRPRRLDHRADGDLELPALAAPAAFVAPLEGRGACSGSPRPRRPRPSSGRAPAPPGSR